MNVLPSLPYAELAKIEDPKRLAVVPPCEVCGETATFKITIDIDDERIYMLFYCEEHMEKTVKKLHDKMAGFFEKMYETARNGML